ncbi:FixH family protein [Granulosicoccus antarcticus]|nr:FixH family protein [Granulosicoccus antarcticus]
MSTAINTPIDDSDRQTKPWYRYGWPWFLISFPLISVLLGIMMVYLALTTNNSLVVDDYYAEGKGINQRIERDRSASLLGLAATVTRTEEGLVLDLSRKMPALPEQLSAEAMTMEAGFHWPTAMQMRWVHVTQAERDGEVVLQSIGGDRFLAAGVSLPEKGKFRIHLQPIDNAPWRLVSQLIEVGDRANLSMAAKLPEEVFNHSEFK